MSRRNGPTLAVYKDKAGEWRWTLQASNGAIIGASSKGYSSPRRAETNADAVAEALIDDELVALVGDAS